MEVYTTFISRLYHFLRDSPYVIGLLDVLSDPPQDISDALDYLLEAFDVDTAAGEQLDLLGELLGLPRPPEQEDKIFTLCRLGEAGDPDNDHGFFNDDDTPNTGGYLVTEVGLDAVDGSLMSDTNYRYLILQRAAAYRNIATVPNLHAYLVAFGSRAKIDDYTVDMEIEIDPVTYYDLNEWEKLQVVTRGFKPAGIDLYFRENMRNEDSI